MPRRNWIWREKRRKRKKKEETKGEGKEAIKTGAEANQTSVTSESPLRDSTLQFNKYQQYLIRILSVLSMDTKQEENNDKIMLHYNQTKRIYMHLDSAVSAVLNEYTQPMPGCL